jgi:hypothetical protein
MTKLDEFSRSMTDALTGSLESSRKLFDHSTIKGDAAENRWIRWLSQHLPRRYAVERALIIDKNAKESEQIDIVVFDPQYTPVIYVEEGIRMLPAESVYAVFEAKQTLNARHIDEAVNKAKSVRALERTSARIVHAGGEVATPKPPFTILAGILALDSEWTPPLGDSLVAALDAAPAGGTLDFGFSAKHGYFFRDPKVPASAPPAWTVRPGAQHALQFLLEFLHRLAGLGTVPAIDFSAYAKSLTP